MAETGLWYFGPFRLDGGAERLWHGTEEVRRIGRGYFVQTPYKPGACCTI